MVALVAIATIRIGMANTNWVLADDSGGSRTTLEDRNNGSLLNDT